MGSGMSETGASRCSRVRCRARCEIEREQGRKGQIGTSAIGPMHDGDSAFGTQQNTC